MKRLRYNKPAEKAEKKEKKQGTHSSFRAFLYSFIVAIAIFVGLIYLEKYLLDADTTLSVYVAAVDIDEKTLVTSDNVTSLFEKVKRSEHTLPEGYLTSVDTLVGKLTSREFKARDVITGDSFLGLDDFIVGIEEPIEVSIQSNNLSQVVGGVLRAGDYVNIWSVKTVYVGGETLVTPIKICERAYVSRTFSSAGIDVNRGDSGNDTAMVINIVIPEADEEDFNAAIANGTIRIGRLLNDSSDFYDDASSKQEGSESADKKTE